MCIYTGQNFVNKNSPLGLKNFTQITGEYFNIICTILKHFIYYLINSELMSDCAAGKKEFLCLFYNEVSLIFFQSFLKKIISYRIFYI